MDGNWEYWGMANETKFIKDLGKRIDSLRTEKGWSYAEIAAECGLEKSQVYRICTGKINVSVSTLVKIAKGLGVPVKSLFDF